MEYKLIRSKRKTIELSIDDDFIPLVKAPLKMSMEDIEKFQIEKIGVKIKENARKWEKGVIIPANPVSNQVWLILSLEALIFNIG